MSTRAIETARGPAANLSFVVASISALAIAGTVMAALMMARSPVVIGARSGTEAGLPGIGADVSTSFGVVAVEYMRQLPGLTSRDLSGMTHGINGLVPADAMQVQVGVAITNELDHPVAYSSRQFRMLVGEAGEAVRAFESNLPGGTLPEGTLQPDASIEMLLTFVVPRDGSRLRVAFTDPDRAEPILIEAGLADIAPEGGSDHGH